ncbi:MAG: GNAT family N-acetyltransferase [Lachnospiraceae bacterium]|nr:GNAT family N-acetyltransferase [Lachnospiraceae bacterium]
MGERMDLTIRKFRESDLDPLAGLLSDPAVMKYLEPPFSRQKTAAFLRKAGLADPPRIYAAEEEGRFIGYVIFHKYDEDGMEIGWVLSPDCWGRGCASALTAELIGRAAACGKAAVIECDPEQEASRRIAREFGFAYEGRVDGLDVFRKKE